MCSNRNDRLELMGVSSTNRVKDATVAFASRLDGRRVRSGWCPHLAGGAATVHKRGRRGTPVYHHRSVVLVVVCRTKPHRTQREQSSSIKWVRVLDCASVSQRREEWVSVRRYRYPVTPPTLYHYTNINIDDISYILCLSVVTPRGELWKATHDRQRCL